MANGLWQVYIDDPTNNGVYDIVIQAKFSTDSTLTSGTLSDALDIIDPCETPDLTTFTMSASTFYNEWDALPADTPTVISVGPWSSVYPDDTDVHCDVTYTCTTLADGVRPTSEDLCTLSDTNVLEMVFDDTPSGPYLSYKGFYASPDATR